MKSAPEPKTPSQPQETLLGRLARDHPSDRAREQWLTDNAPAGPAPSSFAALGKLLSDPPPPPPTADEQLQRLVWDYVSRTPALAPEFGWRDYAPIALVEMAVEPLSHLMLLATKSPIEASATVQIATKLADFIREQVKLKPEVYRGIAKRRFTWPMPIARKPEHNRILDPQDAGDTKATPKNNYPQRLAEFLRLGEAVIDLRSLEERTPQIRDKVPPERWTTKRTVAVGYLVKVGKMREEGKHMESLGKSTPWLWPGNRRQDLRSCHGINVPAGDLSIATCSEWAMAAFELFERDCNGRPADHPAFTSCAKSGRKKYPRARPPKPGKVDRTALANERDAVRTAFRRAVERIVGFPRNNRKKSREED